MRGKTNLNKGRLEKVIMLYNPTAGSGMFTSHLDDIIRRYEEAGKVVIPIRSFGDITIDDFLAGLNKDTYKEEYSQIIAAGGDGTINFCVNAMMKNNIDLPMAILPSGTANDFAYYFDIPHDIDTMLDIALGGNYSNVDIGVVNGKYFINVAAIGQVVGVSQRTDPTLKNTIGVLAYSLKGLGEATNLKPIPIKITTPEKVYEEKMFFMVVMNGKSAGGFKMVSPNSEINDGLLNVMIFRETPALELPVLFMKILQGTHIGSKHVLNFKTDSLILESEMDVPTDIDGELGAKLPLEFSVLHNKLRIASPYKEEI